MISYRFIFFCLLAGATFLQAQQPELHRALIKPRTFVSGEDIFGGRVFVENKGQFKPVEGREVLYALDNGHEKIFFTSTGLVYELLEVRRLKEKEREEAEHGRGRDRTRRYHVIMEWEGAGAGLEVKASDKQAHYFTYGPSEYNSACFKRLVYESVYPGIDVEYLIPPDKNHGIKYNLIVRPGADVSSFQIAYTGDVKRIKKEADGSVIVHTPLEEIVEHPPVSFNEKQEPLASAFSLRDDKISFELAAAPNRTGTIVIDPWVSTTNTLTGNSLAYDVDYDFLGKTYVYGGYSPFKVACYSVTGALQWVFAGLVSTTGWTSAPLVNQASNFGINKFTSKAYIGQGYVNTGNVVVRLDANGNYDNFQNAAVGTFQEVWDMGFHCVTTEVFVLGGGTNSNITAATMNTLTAALTLSSFQPAITNGYQDIVSHAIDDQGNLFVIYAGNGAVANRISRVTAGFNNNVWLSGVTFAGFTEQGNKNTYVGPPNLNSNGFNALAVNANYVFLYNGSILGAYDKLTGTLVSSVTVPGHTWKQQGGIAVDDCNQVYIGGNGAIVSYSYNGTTFSTLTPIPLSTSAGNQFVYDIKLDKSTKTLYACGSGFVGVYSPVHSLACATASSICLFNQGGIFVTSSDITCASLGSATCTATGGTGPFTYTWLPSMQTTSVATNLSPGSHQIIVHDIGANNTYTSTTYIAPLVPLTGTVTNPLSVNCFGQTSATAAVNNLSGGSGNQHYLWTDGTTTQTTAIATGLGLGNYSVTVTDALTSCIYSQTFAVVQPPPLTLSLVASGYSVCAEVKVILSPFPGGGTPNYSYSWTNGPVAPSHTVTEAQGGNYVYTLTVTDSKNCAITQTIGIHYSPVPQLSVSPVSICPGQSATLSVGGALTYTWADSGGNNPTLVVTPSVSSIYTVAGSGTLCSTSKTTAVIIKSVPVPTLSANSPVCAGQPLSFTAAGGTGYYWTGPLLAGAGGAQLNVNFSSVAHSGPYNVTVTAANNCTASASIQGSVHPLPSIAAVGSTICVMSDGTLSASSAASGSSFMWSGPAGFSASQATINMQAAAVSQSGHYTVQVTDQNGCKNQASAHLTVSPMPAAHFTASTPICENSTLQLNASSSTGALHYAWYGPNGFTGTQQQHQLAGVAPAASGIYTLHVFHGPCMAAYSSTVQVHPLPTVTVSVNNPVCETTSLSLVANASAGVQNYAWSGPGSAKHQTKDWGRDSTTQAMAGNYVLTVTDANQCSVSVNQQVVIEKNPQLSAQSLTVCFASPAVLSAGGAASYLWTGPGFVAAGESVTVPVAGYAMPVIYTVTGTGLNLCQSKTTITLSTFPLPVPGFQAKPSLTVCLHEAMTFRGEGGMQYEWRGPNDLFYKGELLSFAAGPPFSTGVYTLTAIDKNGCKGSLDTALKVQALPFASLTGNMEACVPLCSDYRLFQPSSVNLTSVWKEGKRSFQGPSFYVCFNEPGIHELRGILKDTVTGCTNTTAVNVYVRPNPIASFDFYPSLPVENQDEVQFTNTSAGEELHKFNWFFENNKGFKANTMHASYRFTEAGSYPVVLIAENIWGCLDTVVQAITVVPDHHIFVPNAFTPNADGRNEVFIPVMRAVKMYHLQIFDRWGALLFETVDPNQGWDGSYRGKACKSDVYVWKINLSTLDGRQKELGGHVTLLK